MLVLLLVDIVSLAVRKIVVALLSLVVVIVIAVVITIVSLVVTDTVVAIVVAGGCYESEVLHRIADHSLKRYGTN